MIRRLLERSGLLLHVKKCYYAAESRLHLRRARGLFGHVCPRGSLVFDVGANLGQKTLIFVSLGARVISIEPERGCYEYVRRRFQGNDRVTALNVAVSDAPGRVSLFVSPQTPEISTLDRGWLTSGPDREKVGRIEEQPVDVMTLGQLVERFGAPDYVKVDVEGFETRVLRGLTMPVRHLSFEFHADDLQSLVERCRIVAELGRYTFNYTVANTYALALPAWVPADALVQSIGALPGRSPAGQAWGDVFARLEGS